MLRYFFSLLILSSLPATSVLAEEAIPAATSPQSRRKLDPMTRTAAIVRPAPVATNGDSTPAPTMMSRFVVKEEGLLYLLRRRPAVEDPQGKFNFKDGGRLYRKDTGPFRAEIGMWPHISISPEEDAFTGRGGQSFDLIRIKW
jgi:hypothetical protein